MAIDVTEATFDRDVIELSKKTPVVVDFWAEWCGPCKSLTPALEAAEASRGGRVLLAKVDVDANKALAGRYGVQGIPAVKAFRDGKVATEFVGAVPPAKVEAFFDALLPSRADELLAKGDELSLREAAELEPRRADVAVALGRARLERGAEDEALEAVEAHEGDFAAAGIAARVRLSQAGVGADAFTALDRGDREAALDALLDELTNLDGSQARTASTRTEPVTSSAAPSSASSASSTPPTPRLATTAASSPPPSADPERISSPHTRGQVRSASGGKLGATLDEQDSQAFCDLARFPFDPPSGDPDRIDSSELQVLLAQPVALERRSRLMAIPTIDFDREALSLPVGVELVAGNERVDGGPRQSLRFDGGQEEQLRAGAIEDGKAIEIQRIPQPPCARDSASPREHEVDLI